MPTDLDGLKNLGPATRRWLAAVGVRTREALSQLGPLGAYRLLKGHGYPVTRNLLYAVQGALDGVHWARLPAGVRRELARAHEEADRRRCGWCGTDPLYVRYHDEEWGVPVHDDRRQFEFLILECAQAGLSWITILRKREHYRKAFAGFDPERVARFTRRDVARLLANPGIVRNRLKIESAVRNARAFLEVQEAFGSFDAYLWRFVDGRPIVNRWKSLAQLPARTKESDLLSRDLKRRGFAFVGSTIVYAHMQATGMVNDHLVDCFRHRELRTGNRGNRRGRA